MANKFRSSFEIKLNGQEYTLRPSFEAIMEFNDKAGMDIFEALAIFSNQKVNVKIIVSCIWAGIQGEAYLQNDRNAPSFEKVGRECQSHGFVECLPYAMNFLTNAVASEKSLKKLEGEAPEKQTGE